MVACAPVQGREDEWPAAGPRVAMPSAPLSCKKQGSFSALFSAAVACCLLATPEHSAAVPPGGPQRRTAAARPRGQARVARASFSRAFRVSAAAVRPDGGLKQRHA